MSGGGEFRPPWWLRNPHLQTLWPFLFRRPALPKLHTERLELHDGDFIDLAWAGPEEGPLVLVLHGLEGSLRSHYARGLMRHLAGLGCRVLLMHFRGCSGEPNRLPRSYHSGETGDLRELLEHLADTGQGPVRCAVGYSLGGNVLLKYLGESGADSAIETAVAVSVPFQLMDAALRMGQGLSRLYQWHLVSALQHKYRQKFARRESPLQVDVKRLKDFLRFDDQVTAPLHGFAGVDDYYARSSSRQFLPRIRRPSLLLHAADDPFMFADTVPDPSELPSAVRLELSPHGGHVGFVQGHWPWRMEYRTEGRIERFLRAQGVLAAEG